MREKWKLAIETSIRGGSLALFRGSEIVDGWTGNREVSKAEDILEQINHLLTPLRVERNQIELMIMSTGGAGSLTGSRIGQATVLGLQRAWNCHWRSVDVFEAMARLGTGGNFLTAVPVGRDRVAFRNFGVAGDSPTAGDVQKLPQIETIGEFVRSISNLKSLEIITHDHLYFQIINAELKDNASLLINAGENLARLAGGEAFKD